MPAEAEGQAHGRRVGPRNKARREAGLRAALELRALMAVQWALATVSIGAGYRAFEALTLLGFYFVSRLRRRALHNLAIAYGEKSLAWRRRILWDSARYLAWTTADWLNLPRLFADERLRRQLNVDNVIAAAERAGMGQPGGGLLILSGHQGNADLLATAVAYRLSRRGITMIVGARVIDNVQIHERIYGARDAQGRLTTDKRGYLRQAVRILKAGGVAAMMVDQDAGRQRGVFVPFFGRLASTTPGAAQIARLARPGLVLPMFGLRERPRKPAHRVDIYPVELPSTGDRDRDMLEWTRRITAAVEASARAYPEQCLWLHRRWKSRPEGEREEV